MALFAARSMSSSESGALFTCIGLFTLNPKNKSLSKTQTFRSILADSRSRKISSEMWARVCTREIASLY